MPGISLNERKGPSDLNTSLPPSYRTEESINITMAPETKPHKNWSLPQEYKRKQKKTGQCDETFLKAFTVLLYPILFVLVHGTGVLHILILLSLTSSYGQTSGSKKEDIAVDMAFCSGLYALCSFLLALWRAVFRTRKRFNKTKSLLLIVIELISTTGEFLLLFRILSELPSETGILAMLCIMIIPSFLHFVRSFYDIRCSSKRRRSCSSFLKNVFTLLPFIVQTTSLVLLVKEIITNVDSQYSKDLPLLLPVSVVMKSVGFWENFCQRKSKRYECEENEQVTEMDDQQSTSNNGKRQNEDDHLCGLFKSLTKVLVVITVIVLLKLHVEIPMLTYGNMFNEDYILVDNGDSNLTEGTSVQTTTQTEIIGSSQDTIVIEWIKDFYLNHHLAIKLTSLSIVFPYFAHLACRLHMQRFSFALPLVTIPISLYALTHLTCMLKDSTLNTIMVKIGVELTCSTNGPDAVYYRIGIGTALLITGLVLMWFIWFPDVERMAKLNRLFTLPLRDGLFTVFDVLLRRKNDQVKTKTSVNQDSTNDIPTIKICVTMWHETKREMVQLLKSLFKLDRHVFMREELSEKLKKEGRDVDDKDKINIEMHVVFDNAFEYTTKGPVLNEYVLQFIECMEKAARETIGPKYVDKWIEKYSKSRKAPVGYGGRLTFILPGQTKMTVHLKDKNKVRIKKRWSQVLYMYYTLLFGTEGLKQQQVREKLRNTYIFTLDGDVDFEPKSVWMLLDRMRKNPGVGAVCGRIHPIGSGPMVWYQQFEYAVGHWLQKASEHVFGCVLCCPGCFSLFRGSALVDHNVLKTYTREPQEGKDLVQFEQGEDRWLCTLLLKRGYKIDYCAEADARTFAPEGFFEFFIQRRRWSPSTIANMLDLIMSWGEIVKNNREINHFFMLYQCVLVCTSLLSPATVIILIAGSFSAVLKIGAWHSFLVSICPVILFAISCFKCKQENQLLFAGILSTAYTFVMVIVTVGMILNIVSESVISPNVLFLAFVGVIFIVAALIHPKEFCCIFGGLLYFVTVPSTFIFLTVFYMCNMNDISWGTREKKTAEETENSLFELLMDFLRNFLRQRVEETLQNTNANRMKPTSFPSESVTQKPHTDEERNVTDEQNWMTSETLKEIKKLNASELKQLEAETLFWENIIHDHLRPLDKDEKKQKRFREELFELRNKCVYGFFMVNIILALILLVLQVRRDQLQGFYILGKYEPVSTVCLTLFSILLVIQVAGMFKHRWGTFLHLISITELSTRNDNVDFEATFNQIDDEYNPEPEPKAGYEEPPVDYNDDEQGDTEDSFNMYRRHINMTLARHDINHRHQRQDARSVFPQNRLRHNSIVNYLTSRGRRQSSRRQREIGHNRQYEVNSIQHGIRYNGRVLERRQEYYNCHI